LQRLTSFARAGQIIIKQEKSNSMVFDLDLIKKTYSEMPAKVDAARTVLGRPLTLAEKILYAHLWNGVGITDFERGKAYVDFAPDRVAMQVCHCTDGIASV